MTQKKTTPLSHSACLSLLRFCFCRFLRAASFLALATFATAAAAALASSASACLAPLLELEF